MLESSHMTDLSMLQLKYRDYKEIVRQDWICAKKRLPKNPAQAQKKTHYLNQLALRVKDTPFATLYSLLTENFHKQLILCSAETFFFCVGP